jgi:hypothetical protein
MVNFAMTGGRRGHAWTLISGEIGAIDTRIRLALFRKMGKISQL